MVTERMKRRWSGPMEMHRMFWSESLDMDVLALVVALHRAYESTATPAREIWARHGLTSAEFDVLATLRRSPPPRELTPPKIQEALLITSGGLTKVMQKLELRGFVRRSRDEGDQRIRPVRLTPVGRRLVEKAMAEVMAASTMGIRQTMSERSMRTLVRQLERIAAIDFAARDGGKGKL